MTMRTNSPLQLGFLLPLVLLVIGAVEVGLRLLPVETFTYRAWEAVSDRPLAGAPFGPDIAYYTPATYGDLAALGNQPSMREYRSEQFTTDRLGYRNPPALANGAPVDTILLGTSFSVGAGMSDHETLAAQLGTVGSRVVYNASGPEFLQATALARLRTLTSELTLRNREVVYEYLERYDPPVARPLAQQEQIASLLTPPCSKSDLAGTDRVRCELTRLIGPTLVSPLRIEVSRAFRQVENDRILPNASHESVVSRPLRNGDSMLFLPLDLSASARPRSEPEAAEYFVWLQRELAQIDLRLKVVLVPDKSTVYGALLAEPLPSAHSAVRFLDDLAADLQARGVNTVSLVGPLRQAAAEGLDRGEYVYWRDDTHWNPRGIRIAAEAIERR
jgi:hypothetical protein